MFQNLRDRISTSGELAGAALERVVGSRNQRALRRAAPIVREIQTHNAWAQELSEAQYKAQTADWRARVAAGEVSLDAILPQAFALAREAARRTLGLRPYDVQLVGAMTLYRGAIAEMKTGEGKTLMACLPLYLQALSGRPTFLVTVNDYLAARDAAWIGPVFEYLGLTCGAIQSGMAPEERAAIYAKDVVYATNSELGFDYLRDHMRPLRSEPLQRDLAYAVIDEVDSILIDEARTPLIIAGQEEPTVARYLDANRVARTLVRGRDYELKEKERSVVLLEAGIVRAQEHLGVASFYDEGHTAWPHFIENALRAHELYERDREYVVEKGEVVIVDEFTGRKMEGRRWSEGLHQAVEAKERLRIQPESRTLGMITYQNYFRLFDKLAGMTGTATTEAKEFHDIYALEVVSVPTNEPVLRVDHEDVVFRTAKEKWQAIVDEIERVHAIGQPVLVGTTSVDHSERLSDMLQRRGIPHEVLNARQHEREALVVAGAGRWGAVTVATNMAGRGTDIRLGGQEQGANGQDAHDGAEILELGGLYVIGTERHESRRIDNQLRGRAGRQGDVGESRFFVSLEDPLMRRFAREWVSEFLRKLGMEEGMPIESSMVSRGIERAQRKVEERHFEERKYILEYDEVMDRQRRMIYELRGAVLAGDSQREALGEMLRNVAERARRAFAGDAGGLGAWALRSFDVELTEEELGEIAAERVRADDVLLERLLARYAGREQLFGAELMRNVEREVLLHVIDARWVDHLQDLSALRQGIGLRSFAQRDPKHAYKEEAFALFERLLGIIEDQVTSFVLRAKQPD